MILHKYPMQCVKMEGYRLKEVTTPGLGGGGVSLMHQLLSLPAKRLTTSHKLVFAVPDQSAHQDFKDAFQQVICTMAKEYRLVEVMTKQS